jgi:ABC-type lipoprotein release transport system permease subunit
MLACTKHIILLPSEKFSYIETNQQLQMQDEMITKVKAFPEVKKTINSTLSGICFRSISAYLDTHVLTIPNPADLNYIANYINLELSNGRLPIEAKAEAVFHENILKNLNLKVGDLITSGTIKTPHLIGDYKIVGSFTGDLIIGIASAPASYNNNSSGIIVIPKEGKLNAINTKLKSLDPNGTRTLTYSREKSRIEIATSLPLIIFKIIGSAILITLSFCISAFSSSIYLKRSEEFGIMHAVGYDKSFITKLIIKELANLTCLAYIFGCAISMAIITIINHFIFSPKGQNLTILTAKGFLGTAATLATMFLFAGIPILRRLTKWNPISVIERRN